MPKACRSRTEPRRLAVMPGAFGYNARVRDRFITAQQTAAERNSFNPSFDDRRCVRENQRAGVAPVFFVLHSL
jgi:hypothetical protein